MEGTLSGVRSMVVKSPIAGEILHMKLAPSDVHVVLSSTEPHIGQGSFWNGRVTASRLQLENNRKLRCHNETIGQA